VKTAGDLAQPSLSLPSARAAPAASMAREAAGKSAGPERCLAKAGTNREGKRTPGWIFSIDHPTWPCCAMRLFVHRSRVHRFERRAGTFTANPVTALPGTGPAKVGPSAAFMASAASTTTGASTSRGWRAARGLACLDLLIGFGRSAKPCWVCLRPAGSGVTQLGGLCERRIGRAHRCWWVNFPGRLAVLAAVCRLAPRPAGVVWLIQCKSRSVQWMKKAEKRAGWGAIARRHDRRRPCYRQPGVQGCCFGTLAAGPAGRFRRAP